MSRTRHVLARGSVIAIKNVSRSLRTYTRRTVVCHPEFRRIEYPKLLSRTGRVKLWAETIDTRSLLSVSEMQSSLKLRIAPNGKKTRCVGFAFLGKSKKTDCRLFSELRLPVGISYPIERATGLSDGVVSHDACVRVRVTACPPCHACACAYLRACSIGSPKPVARANGT